MECYQDDDLTRVKELLRHTGEFIAYFELAETKMMEWRDEIGKQSFILQQQTKILNEELILINKLLSQTGITQFHNIAHKTLIQGQTNLELLENSCNQFTKNFLHQQEQLSKLTEICVNKIEKHTTQIGQSIANQLAKYDAHQFHRIASESCDHVERVANNAVKKSHKILSIIQLRLGLFATFITILTAFIMVLYLSDELPWEMHYHALSERQAGQVLLQAWPNLSQKEKAKILNHDGANHG